MRMLKCKAWNVKLERLAWFGLGIVFSLTLMRSHRGKPRETRVHLERAHSNLTDTGEDVFQLATYPRNLIHKRSIRIPSIKDTVHGQGVNSTIQNTRRFSHFRCSGDEKSTSSFKSRICVFENTCYNTLTNNFEYYIRPDSPQVCITVAFKI